MIPERAQARKGLAVGAGGADEHPRASPDQPREHLHCCLSQDHRATSCTLWGIDARPVVICALVQDGPPQIVILGLPPSAVRVSRERVRAALRYSGYDFRSQSIVIRLAPADL